MQITCMSACAAGMLFLSGCLINGSSQENLTGIRISQSSLSQIEVGTTTSEWVEAAFGHPTSRQVVTRNDAVNKDVPQHMVEIWRYEWSRSVSSSGEVFLLLSSYNSKVDSTTVFLEFTDGIVTRYWTENSG